MVPPLEESEDGNRASFPRWGKRSVIYNHFTELDLEIREMEMRSLLISGCLRSRLLTASSSHLPECRRGEERERFGLF